MTILRILTAVFVFAMGAFKLAGAGWEMEAFRRWGYPGWLIFVIGAAEVSGALLLAIPKTRRWGAMALAGIMVGAVYTHLSRNEEIVKILPALAALVVCGLQFRKKPAPKAP